MLPVAYTPLGLISEARPEFIGKDVIKTDQKLGELAQKYGKTRAQIALRYLVRSFETLASFSVATYFRLFKLAEPWLIVYVLNLLSHIGP